MLHRSDGGLGRSRIVGRRRDGDAMRSTLGRRKVRGRSSVAQRGDDPATLDDLLRQLTPHLRYATRSALGPATSEVDDCLQETLVAVSAALRSFRAESSLVHFAVAIAGRRARGARRRLRNGQQRATAASLLEAPLLASPQSPDESALRAERIVAIQSLLERLPLQQAAVVTMRIVLGKSLAEVARATGTPVNTVRSRLRLAREALRVHIADDSTMRELLRDSH
jgi:RNA polymerase sigma factor (sigma-70 family)